MPITEEKYYVFLSYSHRDAEKYGRDHINNIKDKIEECLSQIPNLKEKPCVFLDAEALSWGDTWNSKIIEKLNECKLFICLYSENYRKSEYCKKERLWWAYKEVRTGRIRSSILPIYYIKLDCDPHAEDAPEEIKEIFSLQLLDDRRAWVEINNSELEEHFFPKLCKKVLEKLDAGLNSKKSFCSVRPVVSMNFVGRNKELREIWDLCRNNRIPVIHAAGGVGKTELAVAFACGHGEHYMGGRFMIPMEGVNNWGKAFKKMIEAEGMTAEGRIIPVWEALNLPKELKEKTLNEIHKTVWEKLKEKAQKEVEGKSQRILILLDNVDNPEMLSQKQILCLTSGIGRIPDGIEIIATTRVEYKFGQNDNAVNYEIDTLDEKSAVTMFGNICGNAIPCLQYPPPNDDQSSPFDLIAENKAEYSAMCKIVRLLQYHPWSLEIVAGYMCQHYNDYNTYKCGEVKKFGFQKKFAELQKDFQIYEHKDLSSWRNVNSVTKLLAPTVAKLKEHPAVFEIACVAAHLPPDCIPNFILQRYWNTYWANETSGLKISFAKVLNVLQKYHIIREEKNFYKMHRLTALELKKISKSSTGKTRIEENLRKTLLFVNNEEWINAITHTPDLFHEDFLDNFTIMDLAKISHYRPDVLNLININHIQRYLLPNVLKEQPRITESFVETVIFTGAEYIDLIFYNPKFIDNKKLTYDFLSTENWVKLLSGNPDFPSDNCPWENFSSVLWSKLLSEQPRFAKKCDKWGEFNGVDWSELLSEQPQFAKKCDKWEELDGNNWSWLLRKQPSFAKMCDKWSEFDGGNWSSLLSKQPQFAKMCDIWSEFDGDNWSRLLCEQPQFAKKCDKWEEFNGVDWSRLLCKQSQFADKCDWEKLETIFCILILEKCPDLAEKCKKWESFGGLLWSRLLCEQPQFAKKCDKWEEFDEDNWSVLLCKQPQFAEKCDWKKISNSVCRKLFQHQPTLVETYLQTNPVNYAVIKFFPELAQRFTWETQTLDDWVNILIDHPSFEKYFCQYHLWEDFSGKHWGKLLRDRPQFVNLCDWEKLDSDDWKEIIVAFPQWGDSDSHKCQYESLDWSILLNDHPFLITKYPGGLLSGEEWVHLLAKYPQWSSKTEWETFNRQDWESLNFIQPNLVQHFATPENFGGSCWCDLLLASDCSAWEDLYDWQKLIPGNWEYLFWCNLLLATDSFAWEDLCDWQKLTPDNWGYLLRHTVKYRKEFEKYCGWENLHGKDWYIILSKQPQLADKCNKWGEFDEDNWGWLLSKQPQFFDKCNKWEEFDGDIWSRLLSEQPQFADKCNKWEEFDGDIWSRLLSEQPNFAKYCDWKKLDGDSWNWLLIWQPQFAEYRDQTKLDDSDPEC